ncbi:hypothetical protein N7449_006628 [Penicillium cf. viridicatum]|uniref:GATA-type domain-containing protein n=1 Tax=Penicillium cf. viridicatum TaxID=2972119 RepID=A0A9W9MBW7_9EURO|nr:hypothetical protein N7449_006628 [Penicillium cf. viridicatum]
MASSQPGNPLDDEGNETTDSPETDHDDSEDRPDDLDAEEEIAPEHDSDDDDDDELDTRGCVPDSEDHVESEWAVEEDEGDDNEDDDSDDGNKLTISRPTISEPFGPTNPYDLESEDVCLERCDRRLANATEFLKVKTNEVDWDGKMSPETWVYRGFKQAMERSSAEKIIQIFKEVIPASTRAILGRSTLTHEDIMALPIVDNSVARPGVYVICLTQSEDQHPEYFGALCLPSCQVHANFGTKLLDDRRLPNKEIVMYLYCYAKKYGLVPSYWQIAIFPERLEEIDFPHTDTRWLVRMLEHVVILLLDTYGPSQTNPHKQRYGYTEEMYLGTLAQCGIPLSIFHPLNHAMPLKQKCGWTVGARVCQNCESQTTTSNGWYYDPTACEVAVLYNFSACYWYRFRHGTARPPELFVGLKARPTSGPCSNCQATDSAQWEWHPRDKNHVICSKCRSHWTSTVQTVV